MSVTTTGQDYLSMAIDIATTNVPGVDVLHAADLCGAH